MAKRSGGRAAGSTPPGVTPIAVPGTTASIHSGYHVLDASWTALLMLRWHEELEADQRLVDYARTYADRVAHAPG